MILGIDQSKRSTAITALDMQGNLKDFLLINPPKELDKEDLLLYQWEEIRHFIERQKYYNGFQPIVGAALEGLSFGSVGAAKDLLAGLQWYVRARFVVEYPEIPLGVIPVASWRSKILSKTEQASYKKQYKKDGLKVGVIEKLPKEVLEKFEDYVKGHEDRIREVKGSQWKDSLYDLGDSWGIAKHRLSLE